MTFYNQGQTVKQADAVDEPEPDADAGGNEEARVQLPVQDARGLHEACGYQQRISGQALPRPARSGVP